MPWFISPVHDLKPHGLSVYYKYTWIHFKFHISIHIITINIELTTLQSRVIFYSYAVTTTCELHQPRFNQVCLLHPRSMKMTDSDSYYTYACARKLRSSIIVLFSVFILTVFLIVVPFKFEKKISYL